MQLDVPVPPIDISHLFADPAMFDSFESFHAAGFKVKSRSANKIMVGRHSSTDGYLFKKHTNQVPLDEQLTNYRHRVEGAHQLRTFIAEHHLEHVAVPQKWLYQLPQSFSEHMNNTNVASYILIVERLEVLDKKESIHKYRHISEAQLRELCVVLFKFRGLDSSVKNMPFIKDRRIAFIDTEKWSTQRDQYLGKIRDRLSSKDVRFAEDVFRELEKHHQPT